MHFSYHCTRSHEVTGMHLSHLHNARADFPGNKTEAGKQIWVFELQESWDPDIINQI